MRTRLIAAALILMALSSAPCHAAIRWLKSYDDGLKIATELGRPLCMVLVRKGDKNVKAVKKLFMKSNLVRFSRVFIFAYEELEIVNRTVSSRLFGKFKHQGNVAFPYFFFVGPGEVLYGKTMDKSAKNLEFFCKLAYHKHGKVADPKKLKAIVTKLKKADALHEKGQFGAAASLYHEIVATKVNAPPVEAAQGKLAKISETANQQLADARSDIADKAYPDAIEKLADLQRNFAALKAGHAARKELARLRENPAAQEAFAALAKSPASIHERPAGAAPGTGPLAKTAWQLDGFTDAELDALDAMAAGTPAAAAAEPAVNVSKRCRRLLGLARNWIANKQPDKARKYLEQILDEHPDTLFADQAKALLDGLQ